MSASPAQLRGGPGGCSVDMADLDPRYPCASIEDDFNYGSCVASASVHIRMGTSPGPSRPPLAVPPRRRPQGAGFRLLRRASSATVPRETAGLLGSEGTFAPPGPLAG